MRRLLATVLALCLLELGCVQPAWGVLRLQLPVSGRVSRGFNPPPKPWLAGHRGVDLVGHQGMVVRAAAPGTVTFAEVLAGRGVVVISHGALRTTYQPVSASVVVGQRVSVGDAIGRLDAGHRCPTSACLHWGLKRGDTYLNPLAYVGGEVVLLPLPPGVPRRGVEQLGWTARASPGAQLPR